MATKGKRNPFVTVMAAAGFARLQKVYCQEEDLYHRLDGTVNVRATLDGSYAITLDH